MARKYLSNDEACYMCFVCPDYCTKTNIILSPSPPPQKYQMSPLLIIMVAAISFLLFSYVIASWCRYKYSSSPRNNIMSDENQDSHNWFINQTAGGLPRWIIESIGVVRYKRRELLGDCCMICLSEFEEEERLRVLTKCAHAFHVACIDTWLMSHINCPVCRASLIFLSKDDDTSDYHHIGAGISDVELVGAPTDHDHFSHMMIIRRSLSVDFLQGTTSIRTLQLVPIKRSSSFTGNMH